MARRDVELTLAGDTWEVGCGAMYMVWEGWGAGRAHGLCAPFPLLCCPACPLKVRNDNCERGCEEKLIQKKSSLSGWKGVPSHKRARVHNNLKSEDLILKRKVSVIEYIKQTLINFGWLESQKTEFSLTLMNHKFLKKVWNYFILASKRR